MTIRIGLCSVTFRGLSAAQIVTLAAEARLESIEWGGDIHVPAGDTVAARNVAALPADAGLAVATDGSYFRAGEGEDIGPALDSAAELGASRIRVWAGSVGSAEADATDRARTIDRLRDAAIAASERRLELALEFHGGTLADTPEATLSVLDDVRHPALRTYWQPTVGASDEVAVAEYRRVADRVSAVHVFSWWPRTERMALTERDGLWRELFAAAAATPTPPQDALLEFVPDDDPAVLAREAAALRGYRDDV